MALMNYLTSAEITSATAKPHWFTGRNLVDQLEHEHLSWKAYMQSMPESDKTVECAPTNPATGGPIKLYAQEHNPDLSSRNRIFTTPTVPCRNYKRY